MRTSGADRLAKGSGKTSHHTDESTPELVNGSALVNVQSGEAVDAETKRRAVIGN
jgi:hypothetical protein